MSRRVAALAAIITFTVVTLVHPHAGLKHVMGTVAEIGPGRLVIKTTDGKMVEVHLDKATKYLQGKQEVDASKVGVGTRVVAEAAGNDGHLLAKEVRIGAAPSSPEAKKP